MSAASLPQREPATLEEFDACLRDSFIALDGPPLSFVTLGSEQHKYVLFGVCAEGASNSALVALLWRELHTRFPAVKTVLFWRMRPRITEFERRLFGEAGPTREEVQDGAEIPPGHAFDFDSGRYRELLGRHMVRAIHCRVWWPGLLAGNKQEGEETPVAKRHSTACSDQNPLKESGGFYMGACRFCDGGPA